jgi:hypothetical protein
VKLRYDLIPVMPLRELARTYTIGAEKYKPDDWKEKYRTTQVYSKLMRHLEAWRGGEDKDVEGQYHLAAVAFHAMTLLWLCVFRPDRDDMPDRNSSGDAVPASTTSAPSSADSGRP